MAKFILRGKSYTFEPKDVENAVKGNDPGNIQKYAVKLQGKEYPIKQVVRLLTKLDSAEFTAHDAYRVLRKIGFGITVYD
jgi:hypothetical protein